MRIQKHQISPVVGGAGNFSPPRNGQKMAGHDFCGLLPEVRNLVFFLHGSNRSGNTSQGGGVPAMSQQAMSQRVTNETTSRPPSPEQRRPRPAIRLSTFFRTPMSVLDSTAFKGSDVSAIKAAVAALNNLSQAQILSDTTPFKGSDVAAIKAKTDALPASPMPSTIPSQASPFTDYTAARAAFLDYLNSDVKYLVSLALSAPTEGSIGKTVQEIYSFLSAYFNQTLRTTDSPTFSGLTVHGNPSIAPSSPAQVKLLMGTGVSGKSLYLGVAYASSDLVTGSVQGDVILRAETGNILFTTNGGGSIAARIDNYGSLVISSLLYVNNMLFVDGSMNIKNVNSIVFNTDSKARIVSPTQNYQLGFYTDNGAGTLIDRFFINGNGAVGTVGVICYEPLTVTQSIVPITSVGAATYAFDVSSETPLTILNAATATPLGNNSNFAGLILITETGVSGSTAVFLVGGFMILLGASNGGFSVAQGTAYKTNVYLSNGVVTMENKTGSTCTYQVVAFRTRTTD